MDFECDHVFKELDGSREVNTKYSNLLLSNLLKGIDSFCLFYGQTGAGKTFTMLNKNGVIVHFMRSLYFYSKKMKCEEISVEVSSYQIYNNKTYDLLDEVIIFL